MGGQQDSSDTAQVQDFHVFSSLYGQLATPVWFYDSSKSCNVWGNTAALELFAANDSSFTANQLASSSSWSSDQIKLWGKLNTQIHQDVEVSGKDISVTVTSLEPVPGFLHLDRPKFILKAVYKPLRFGASSGVQGLTLVQVVHQIATHVEDTNHRLVEMCNNHPMFQFLFDEHGRLLTANKRAIMNMREHLGSGEHYTLQRYLSIGEYDGSQGPEDVYREAMDAIFKEGKDSHRFPQLRWSKRHPGKYRWVLYEMWPLTDPVTQARAVLVCEQNISQVKALEDEIRKQNQRLEAQLEEALAQRDPVHRPAIDIDTPADKTLKLLDKIMRGLEVSAREAIELRDAIVQAGDLRQPVNFNEQLMRNSQTVLDNEVSQSLIQLLSSRRPAKIVEEDELEPAEASGAGGHAQAGGAVASAGAQPYTRTATSGRAAQDSVKALIALHRSLPDAVMEVLAKVDDWQFDAFKLNEVSGGRPLSLLAFALFKRCEMLDKFELDEHKLVKFLMRIEEGYPTGLGLGNPYHNRIHAADVLQSLHVLVVRGGLVTQGYCDEISFTSCYLSAIIHDYEHKGVNNDYLIRVSDDLAVLYNDRSPMENHHLASSFQLLNSDEFNFMRKVPHKTKETLRKQIIEMVLATDMKQHFAIHSMFQAKMQLGGAASSGSGGGNSNSKGIRSSAHSTQDHKHIFDEDQRSLALQVALKCADLGHLASPRIVHKKWVQYLEEEFFRQGDREKQNSLAVSPLMDRDKNGITKSQVGFFDIVALPLFQSFAQAFNEATPMLEAVKDNYAMWREEAALFSTSASNAKNSK